MSLRAAKLSPQATEAIASEVAGLAAHPASRERFLGGAGPEQGLQLAAPHPVYTMGLEALAGEPSIEEAELVGQRCLVVSEDQPVAAAEIGDSEAAGGVATTRGPFTEGTVAAIGEVERWDEVAERDYELRLLRVPALYVMALWLHGDEEGEDLFTPLAPVPEGLEEHARYSWRELTDALRPRARQQLEADKGDAAS